MKFKLLIVLLCVNVSLYGLTASFSASTYSGCVSLVVNFTDQSTGAPILWEYDFGDGGSSSSQNPTYTFTKAGKYTVKLRVYDGSVYSTYTRIILVRKLPVADFTVSKTEFCPNETVSFTNLTVKGDTTINTSTWDFGDGNLNNNNGNVSKTYANAGTYTIKLSVRDNFGCIHTATKSQYIKVNPNPVMNFTINTKHSCASPQRVDLNNTSSGSVSYDWDLGDGSTSTSTNPIVYYTTEKTFTIKLSGISSKGCKADYTATVPIKFGKVKAGFTADNFAGCKPFNVKFTSQNLPVSSKFDYSWDFGDNSTSKLENPIKTYMKTGTFKIRLIIAGSGQNCIDTAYKTVVVSDKPTAILEIGDTVSCNGQLSAMYRAKSSKIINYTWFIDGQNIDTKKDSLNYLFSTTGIYQVQVLLIDSFGCQQTFQFPRVVVQDLQAEISMNENGGCAPYTIRFFPKSVIGLNNNIKYEWEDGAGGTYNGASPKMIVTNEGDYELKMKISDGFGCKSEFTLPYGVGHKIKPSFKYNKKSICNLEPIRFENTTPDSLKKLVNSWYWEMSTASSTDRDLFVATFNQREAKLTPKLVTEYRGCRDTLEYYDSIELKPTWSNFEFYFDTCYNTTVRLVNTTAFATYFDWLLPDGTHHSDTTVYYKMKPDVSETIQLYSLNSLTGCQSLVQMKINAPNSVSNIKTLNLSGCTPLPVSFKNFQTSSELNHWDFGNGDTSNQKDTFVYVYKEPGDYIAKHIGWDYRGCEYKSSTIVHIDGPKAKARVWPTIGCLPLKIQLQDSVNLKKIKKRIWKFQDDPQWIILKKPNELLEYTITSMPSNGDSIFNIELMVEDSFGCVTTKVFKIRPIGPKALTEVKKSEECNADQFLCKAELDSATAFYPVDISWDMGDGNIFHKNKVNYFYEKGGTYKAKVTVKDGMGCKYENEYTLKAVDPLILAKFTSDTTNINCPPLITKFKNLSLTDPNNPITYFLWDFGDGTTSNLENPSKIYTQTGKYKVSLTVNSIFNCKSTTAIEDFI
ncbi:MAG TPA: PKD domain-containing protein, partial [Bacteroidia bacterium]